MGLQHTIMIIIQNIFNNLSSLRLTFPIFDLPELTTVPQYGTPLPPLLLPLVIFIVAAADLLSIAHDVGEGY